VCVLRHHRAGLHARFRGTNRIRGKKCPDHSFQLKINAAVISQRRNSNARLFASRANEPNNPAFTLQKHSCSLHVGTNKPAPRPESCQGSGRKPRFPSGSAWIQSNSPVARSPAQKDGAARSRRRVKKTQYLERSYLRSVLRPVTEVVFCLDAQANFPGSLEVGGRCESGPGGRYYLLSILSSPSQIGGGAGQGRPLRFPPG